MQMFTANAVIDAIQPPPDHGKERFHGIRGNIGSAFHVFANAVIDGMVSAREFLADSLIALILVSQDARRGVYVFADKALEGLAGHVRHWASPGASITLDHRYDDLLVGATTFLVCLPTVTRFPADVDFIYLNVALQWVAGNT